MKEPLEGAARTTASQGEQIGGKTSKEKSMPAQGRYDEVVGKAQSALESARDMLASGVDAATSVDFSQLRDDIAKLTQAVSDLARKEASGARDQVMGAVGAAGDNISQSASAAQDRLASMEADVGSRIQKNPWGAVAIAALIGLVIGRIS